MSTPTDRLLQAWSAPPGLVGWMSSVNHRAVGLRYIITAFVFFLLAGILALVMRLQLAQPELEIISPQAYNQFFTMHGTVMMFLFAVPMLEGLGIYLVPLMIGARDMAFPRLNAFAYWVYLFGGLILFAAFFSGIGPDAGWFNYPPLSSSAYSPSPLDVSLVQLGEPTAGRGIDFFLIAVTMLEVAALAAGIELIVTIFKHRAPGMAMHRMPLFVWGQLVTAFMVIVAMPALATVSIMLELDRKISTTFFNASEGGSTLLWQHLFWFFGHPDVYIMLIPGLGITSTIIAASVARPVSGYLLVAASTVVIGILSFGLWVHHMYASGIALMGLSFFGAASMMITIPSGITVFAWIATIWQGALRMSTAFLFAVGTIIIFVAGGITGVMVASPTFDWQVHDTYFVVAHFHYVLIGGAILPIFAALHHWWPKLTGRLLGEGLGKITFWLMFLGINLTFFPMHELGFEGMPRRIYTFLPESGLDDLNFIATIGAFMLGSGVLVFLINAAVTQLRGSAAGDNPWDAGTLEWATASPPEQYNFARIPVIQGRYPLWEQKQLDPVADRVPDGWRSFNDAPRLERSMYITSILEGKPQGRALLPAPSLMPFWLALSVTGIFGGFLPFIGFDVEMWLIPVAVVALYVLGVIWTWPRLSTAGDPATDAHEAPGLLPHLHRGPDAPIWWGMMWLLIIETVVLGSLLFGYFYLRLGIPDWPPLEPVTPTWPPSGIPDPPLILPAIAGALLIASSGALFWANRTILTDNKRGLLVGLVIATGLAIASLAVSAVHYLDRPFSRSDNAYASIVWVMSGYHWVHVLALVLIAAPLIVLAWKGHFDDRRNLGVQAVSIFWHFVSAAWIVYYLTVYVSPYLS